MPAFCFFEKPRVAVHFLCRLIPEKAAAGKEADYIFVLSGVKSCKKPVKISINTVPDNHDVKAFSEKQEIAQKKRRSLVAIPERLHPGQTAKTFRRRAFIIMPVHSVETCYFPAYLRNRGNRYFPDAGYGTDAVPENPGKQGLIFGQDSIKLNEQSEIGKNPGGTSGIQKIQGVSDIS